MSGLFDRLEGELEKREKEQGITPLDLVDLPVALRKIMRLMLRELQMNLPELHTATQNIEETKGISKAELQSLLDKLLDQGWLIQLGEEEAPRYKVNLRRKRSSKLGDSIWSRLGDKMDARDVDE
ncbi:MAG: hypothetical protein DWQ07_16885 [Chloroflexi bacterium]|nr:MAG: hypothetical protein DWQ07_16885 [Chloroflexota bacterium]MBL1195424.1 hypothetical protein [Chloroflexota bacterium]NOH12707.1 hypothetical protein [Chloroflexota bacterium]